MDINRTKVGMVLAEFFGTAILVSLVLAQVNAVGAILSSPWFVAATAGLTLSVLVLALGRVSGGHFNPAVTLGLWSVRKVQTTTAIVYVAAQMLAGICALLLFQYLSDMTVSNIGGNFEWRVFVAEMVGAFIFMHGVAAAVFQRYSGLKAAIVVGASFTLGILVAAIAGNATINPAVALGLNSWSWTYALAPLVGGVLAFNVYSLFFADQDEVVVRRRDDVAVERPVRTSGSTRTTVVTKKKRR
ncbi:MAG: aquaporin [bacterium]|nr:aquaporin [bacterium]